MHFKTDSQCFTGGPVFHSSFQGAAKCLADVCWIGASSKDAESIVDRVDPNRSDDEAWEPKFWNLPVRCLVGGGRPRLALLLRSLDLLQRQQKTWTPTKMTWVLGKKTSSSPRISRSETMWLFSGSFCCFLKAVLFCPQACSHRSALPKPKRKAEKAQLRRLKKDGPAPNPSSLNRRQFCLEKITHTFLCNLYDICEVKKTHMLEFCLRWSDKIGPTNVDQKTSNVHPIFLFLHLPKNQHVQQKHPKSPATQKIFTNFSGGWNSCDLSTLRGAQQWIPLLCGHDRRDGSGPVHLRDQQRQWHQAAGGAGSGNGSSHWKTYWNTKKKTCSIKK